MQDAVWFLRQFCSWRLANVSTSTVCKDDAVLSTSYQYGFFPQSKLFHVSPLYAHAPMLLLLLAMVAGWTCSGGVAQGSGQPPLHVTCFMRQHVQLLLADGSQRNIQIRWNPNAVFANLSTWPSGMC
jgi:hypothetical protein